jgi:4-amino-4-deoxy-L-arabinose transferase-like glycosyltransferase
MTTDVRPAVPLYSGAGESNRPPSTTIVARWQTALAMVLLAVHGVLAWVTRISDIVTHDESDYVLLGRALRHLRYVDVYSVGSPPHSHYPPGYPAFLALLSLAFGEHLDVYIAANIAASVISLWFVYLLIRTWTGPAGALLALAIAALNPSVIEYAGTPLTESPYMMFSVIAVWAGVRASQVGDNHDGPDREGLHWALVAGGAAILGTMVRSIGVAVMGAVFLDWLLARKFRRALSFLAAGALIVGSWFAWVAIAPGKVAAQSYVVDWTYRSRPRASVASTLVERATQNVSTYLTDQLPSTIPQPGIPGTQIDNIINFILFVSAVAVGVFFLWKSARVVVLYLAIYAAELTVYAFGESRLLVPIMPLLLAVAVLGAIQLKQASRWLRWVPAVLAGSIAAAACVRLTSQAETALRCDRRASTTSPTCHSTHDLGFFAAMRYMRDSLPSGAVVYTAENALTGYYTNLYAVHSRTIPSRDPKVVEAAFRAMGGRYILLSSRNSTRAVRLDVWSARCADVTPVKEFPGGTLLLYLPPAQTPPPSVNACAAIARYADAAKASGRGAHGDNPVAEAGGPVSN